MGIGGSAWAGQGRALSATGHGEDAQQARENALAALSRTIVSQVSSKLTAVTRAEDEQVSQSAEDRVSVSSVVLLKGVEYSEPREMRRGGVEVDAFLTPEALRETASFLLGQVTQPPQTLDQAGLRQMAARADLLDALLTTPAARSLPDRKAMQVSVTTARFEANRRLNQGIVVFAGDLAGVQLTLDGEPVTKGTDEHFVSPGEHAFSARKAGHHGLRGRVRVAAAGRRVITVRLVAAKDRGQLHVEAPAGQPFLADELESALAPFGVRVVGASETDRTLRIHLRDDVTAAGKHSKHRLSVFIEAFRAGALIMKVKAKVDYHASVSTEVALRRRKATKLVHKLVPALMKNLDSSAFSTDGSPHEAGNTAPK